MTTTTIAAPSASAPSRAPANAGKAILVAWLLAGTCDILSAFAHSMAYGGTPLGVLRAVASGLIGQRAKGGGWDIGMLGLFLHFFIMLGFVLAFRAASRKLTFMLKEPLIVGPLYGIAVFLFMNGIVLPLSAIVFAPSYDFATVAIGMCIHMLAVGTMIASTFYYFLGREAG